jgi:Flp pilus assembly protein TadD
MSDFEKFKEFNLKWNASMSMTEKIQIATRTDEVNLKGCLAFERGDLQNAEAFFKHALEIMPNNDDALQNLKLCLEHRGDYQNAQIVSMKLLHLGL